MDSDTSVMVAVRVRPQSSREQIDMCRICTYCTPDSIVLGKDKQFTYDFVFDTGTQQEQLYTTCIQDLISGCLEGYNATILAYGQTGSGKTYTMGTGFGLPLSPEEEGVIPRAVAQLFGSISEQRSEALKNGQPEPLFTISAQFLELYNEEIIDLFAGDSSKKLRIHEQDSNIFVAGATEQDLNSVEETLSLLKQGALGRSVGSTNMNAQSSRSHAIFTLHISHKRPTAEGDDWESLTAKLHFVDLAGSERLKRTGATGDRAKEGISINCGLLALGNVISALGDKAKRGSHVPYRDSKLTRFLQDSLGGNSKTLMVACVSPTDRDFMETLNTLKYSNRARNIKNKVTLNQDKASLILSSLRGRIQELEVELQEFKSGRMVVSEDGSVVVNDMSTEITMLHTENDKLRIRVKGLQQVIDSQSTKIASLLTEREMTALGKQDESTGQVVSGETPSAEAGLASVIQGYMSQIEELKSRLVLSESLAQQNPKSPFRRAPSSLKSRSQASREPEADIDQVLSLAKGNIQKLLEQEEERKAKEDSPCSDDSSGDSSSDDSLSDSESDGEHSLASSIAELSSEINLKQQLVDQLERSQNNFRMMKSQYEEKMNLLQQQIRNTESERDQVLKSMSTHRGEVGVAKVKEVKTQYEKQLKDLKAELRQLKTIKKEHARAIKKNAEQDRQMKLLNSQLLELKQQKVKMINKMRQEANVKKADDSRKARELGQLRKEARRKENKIKNLQSEASRREAVLKRRQEEVAVLRRRNRIASDSRPPTSGFESRPPTGLDSRPSTSDSRITTVISSVSNDTSYSSTIVLRERNAGGQAKARRRMSSVFSSDSARRKWREFERKITDAVLKRKTISQISADMDNWITKRDELSHNLEELKKQRQVLKKSKKAEPGELTSVDEDMDSTRAHIDYIQENIVELQNDLIALDDSKADGDTVEAQSIINAASPREAKYLLQHMLDMVLSLGVKAGQKETEVKTLAAKLEASEQSVEIIQSFSSPQVGVTKTRSTAKLTTPPPLIDLEEVNDRPAPKETKSIRRRTALPSEILNGVPVSPANRRKGDRAEATDGDDSPRLRHSSAGPYDARRRGFKRRSDTNSSLDSNSSSTASCPSSPLPGQRSLKTASSESNVWARLAHTAPSQATDAKGSLQAERPSKGQQRLLTCTHTASGHSSGVLSLHATQSYLFSSSQDRTVKVWNLKTGTELLSLDKHFSYVRAVTFCQKTSLIFTASQALIKIWDMRHHRARCIKTFGPPGGSPESVVQDLRVSPCGTLLFSASGNVINIWDLKKFMWCGKLVGHNGAVCALTLSSGHVVTGSRDRLIKLYDVSSLDLTSSISQPSSVTLYPPHYDAVSAFAVHGSLLYSACGVSIKQWDLSERSLKQAVDGAHPQGNAINTLGVLPSPLTPMLLSGCKGGLLKLWQPDSCASIGEVSAHKSSINSIATNDTCIFTGSSDKSVKIWRPCLQD